MRVDDTLLDMIQMSLERAAAGWLQRTHEIVESLDRDVTIEMGVG